MVSRWGVFGEVFLDGRKRKGWQLSRGVAASLVGVFFSASAYFAGCAGAAGVSAAGFSAAGAAASFC